MLVCQWCFWQDNTGITVVYITLNVVCKVVRGYRYWESEGTHEHCVLYLLHCVCLIPLCTQGHDVPLTSTLCSEMRYFTIANCPQKTASPSGVLPHLLIRPIQEATTMVITWGGLNYYIEHIYSLSVWQLHMSINSWHKWYHCYGISILHGMSTCMDMKSYRC